jgi:hypothetical protein
MFSLLKGKLKLDATLVKQLVYMFIIALLYFVLGMINFTTMEFEIGRLCDKNYWIYYILIIGFATVIMFVALAMRKDSLKRGTKVNDFCDNILLLKQGLVDNGLYDDFTDVYLRELNKTRKLNKYREILIMKKDKATNKIELLKYSKLYNVLIGKKGKKKIQNKIDKYSELLKMSYEETFNIDEIMLKIRDITVNTIFSNFSDNRKDAKVFYSGLEDLGKRLLPAVICGMFFSAIMLSIVLNKQAQSIEQWKNLLTTLWVSISYLLRGISYAEYSVNDVFISVLDNRTGIVRSYFKQKGLVANLVPNPHYKNTVAIEKEATDGKPIL